LFTNGIDNAVSEHAHKDSNGNNLLFSVVKVPFTPERSHSKAFLGIATDITGQRKAETERTKMINDIMLRNKDLEQFSYIVSHNLRSPVANIMGLTEVMQMDNLAMDEEKVLKTDLMLSVKKLDTVIMDLNNVLQVKNEVSGKRETVVFSELLKDISLSIGNLIKNDEVQILSDFSEVNEMPTLKGYMYSIFYNLVSNSIKYKQPDLKPVIEIKSYKTDGKIKLIFKDNGLGIDLAKRGAQVFGLYKRFHNHTEGKGIGLFMVKTQVETLGGTIKIKSEVNKGTEFVIEFDSNG